MNLDLVLLLASIVFTILLAAVGVEMANNPPASSRARWIYRSSFITLGGLLIGTTYWQGKRSIDEQNGIKAAAALQEKRSSDRYSETKSQYSQLEGELGTIEKFAKHPPSGFSPQQVNEAIRVIAATGNITFLSNNDLRQETAAYTKALRELERRRGEAYSMTRKPMNLQPGAEERSAHWWAVEEQVKEQFGRDYRDKGISLRNAMIKRLNKIGPQTPTILDDGVRLDSADLCACYEQLADYLDGLAKQLPYP